MQYPEQNKSLVAKCFALGLTMQQKEDKNITTHISVTLQPATMRREELETLYRQQLLWNEAVDNTARNFLFLCDALQGTAESDTNFTGRLVNILRDVYLGTSPYQSLMLGIIRTDYMRSKSAEETREYAANWKNVEFNTISCSFGGFSPLVSDFHQYIATYERVLQGNNSTTTTTSTTDIDINKDTDGMTEIKNIGLLERSTSATHISKSLALAVKAWTKQQDFNTLCHIYKETQSTQEGEEEEGKYQLRDPVVLVIIQESERNMGDQFVLLFQLLEVHHIISIRRTLTELHKTMKLFLIPNQPPLAIIDGCYPVAVAYFRSTYVPTDFPTEITWNVRLDIERSSAIKCPSIPYHLLTFKKIQQLFYNMDNILTPIAFKGNRGKAYELFCHFVPQYSLNPSEVNPHKEGGGGGGGEESIQNIINDALQYPEKYVLKPQLEGGGNLISGENMRNLLQITKDMDPILFHKIRREYILMSRIDFPISSGSLLMHGEKVKLENNLCSELGIFGVILSNGEDCVLFNESAGYIIRSKPANMDDGGVTVGVAALDSLALV